jgi:UDP-N-acetylenolpyruvoylglucosamine reductase
MTLTDLPKFFPELKFESNHVLAPHTTVKIGGPAELYVETPTTTDFTELVTSAKKKTSITILGWGANTHC